MKQIQTLCMHIFHQTIHGADDGQVHDTYVIQLVGQLVGQLVDQLVGQLVDQLVATLLDQQLDHHNQHECVVVLCCCVVLLCCVGLGSPGKPTTFR